MIDQKPITPDDLLTERAARGLSFADRWHRDAYLQRLDWHLEAVVRGRERRAIVRSLRDELSVDRRPMKTAIADLGSPRTLAARYADDPVRLRPTWSIGVIWGGVALLAYWIAFVLFTLGMLSVVEQSTLEEAHARFLFFDVLAFSNADGIGIGWSGGAGWIVVPVAIVALAVLLGARFWRAFLGPRD
jgi:hypothetical protein